MAIICRGLLIATALVVGSACGKAPPAAPALLSTATIKDIMDSMVDPSAEFLFDSVAMVADEHGITEKAPQTDEEWKEVRRRDDPADRSAQSSGDEGPQGRAPRRTSPRIPTSSCSRRRSRR